MANSTTFDVFYFSALVDGMEFKSLLFAVFLIIYLLTLLGNAVIIILTKMYHHLQTPMYFLLRNLSYLDVCYTSTTLPQMLVNLVIEHLAISLPACIIQLYVFLSLAASESSLLATMAYDRYVAICNPLRYSVIMNRDVCVHMVAGTWISCTDTFPNEATVIIILIAVLNIPKGHGRNKPFSTCISHLTVVLLFYGSGCFMYMRPKSNLLADKEWLLSLFYTFITPLLNPIIYSLRNKDIQRAFAQLVKGVWERKPS
ncbi:hypothetical protein GDO78_007206 [Eleutherodactylus coqui]|uniref:G-protein coupled receptors family 1 profile domain-containing protein n=1 Tax=Eleutherodactylus coqui TaxID=57060 RepID=A0A8J6FFS2_ELECQ|nr:hypothetical protein GDO78_007206 [Eleutherodactylus coqui]